MIANDIVRALEERTWAELRVRDWDLGGTAPQYAWVCNGPRSSLAGKGMKPGSRTWAGLLAAIEAGVPTGLRLFRTTTHACPAPRTATVSWWRSASVLQRCCAGLCGRTLLSGDRCVEAV